LIGQPDPEQMAERVIRGGLTVRQTEDLARQTRAGRPGSRQRSVTREKDSDTRALEADLSAALGMAVIVTPDSDPARGTLTVRYETLEGLDWLCAALTRASGGFRD
jgi:ParB family chromosome partitioning protein